MIARGKCGFIHMEMPHIQIHFMMMINFCPMFKSDQSGNQGKTHMKKMNVDSVEMLMLPIVIKLSSQKRKRKDYKE